MKIDILIEHLEQHKEKFGNIEVVVEIKDFFGKTTLSTVERLDVQNHVSSIMPSQPIGKCLLLDWRC